MPSDHSFGFEVTAYLLLFGELPSKEQLDGFIKQLSFYRTLPTNFVRDIIMKAPSGDMMNTLARSVLTMYSYDDAPDDISIPNVLRQCIQLIAIFPLLSVYGYQAYRHYHDSKSLYIHQPKPELTTAENILRILRSDKQFTPLEAKVLDIALMLHAEHGGGNNSTFTTHVVSSSGTDTYSAIAAALGSLKGPKHGGANIKVVRMFSDMKEQVKDWTNENEICDYLTRLLDKKRSITPGSSTAWATPCIPSPTPEHASWSALQRAFPKKKAVRTSTDYTCASHGSRRRSSPKSAASIKVFPQT